MSDEEYEQEWGSDPDEDQPAEDQDQIEIDNAYYEALDIMKTNTTSALEKFQLVILLEDSRPSQDHSFSSLKNAVILHMQLKQFNDMIEQTNRLLQFSKRPTVSKNDASDAISELQDAVSKHLTDEPNEAKQMITLILDSLKQSNERLWFSASLRLGKIQLDCKDFQALEALIAELKQNCLDP